MNCKDCIHCEVCNDKLCRRMSVYTFMSCTETTYIGGVEKDCKNFKDKSKIIELPCRVGDKIYINVWGGNAVPHEVKDISIYINAFQEENMCTCRMSDFGKTVFLTREEAEAALANYNKL